jgi:hypothetical protein
MSCPHGKRKCLCVECHRLTGCLSGKTQISCAVCNTLHWLRKRCIDRISHFMGYGLDKSVEDIIGCPLDWLKFHLESTMTEGMSWDKVGKGRYQISIDHILPLTPRVPISQEELLKRFNWVNTRMVWNTIQYHKRNKPILAIRHPKIHLCLKVIIPSC